LRLPCRVAADRWLSFLAISLLPVNSHLPLNYIHYREISR
jgi:hypothetical protein